MIEYLERSWYLITQYPDIFILMIVFLGLVAYFARLMLGHLDEWMKERKKKSG